jgi:BASS family bile acid:Na+ symporter
VELIVIVKLVLILAMVLIVLAIGLRFRRADPLLLLRSPSLGARAMLSMFVAFPLFVLLVTWLLPLGQPVRAALLALAVSPMPPLLPKKGRNVGGEGDYVIGLQVLATIVSVLVVPVMVWLVRRIFDVHASFDPWAMTQVLLVTVAVPLAIGMALGKLLPGAAPRLSALADRAGMSALMLGAIALIYLVGHAILGTLGGGALATAVVIIGFGLLVGHLLGGPDPGTRGALAVATAARHPGVALVLATSVFPEQESAIMGAVLLYLIANVILTIPYVRWRKRVLASG